MKKSKKIKIIVFSVLGVVVVFGLLFGLRALLNKSGSSSSEVYQVNVETYENVIEISGTVSAANEQKLQAKSDGTVVGVYVKAGDTVKKGDIILQLDDTTEQYNLAQHDYNMDVTRVTGSAKELSLMKTQRLSLVQKIEDRKVTATFDGVIADLDVAVGDSLEAKDAIGTLVNTDYLTAEVEVSETDVAKLQVGQEVDLTFSAYSGTVKGYVESWPKIGEVTSRGATVVEAKIRIDDYPEEILPYYSFTGKIQIEAPRDNIVVNKLAIGYDEDKNAYVVLAKTNEKVSVKVRPYGSDYVKVLEGLSGGEMVLQQQKSAVSGQNKDRQQYQHDNQNKTNGQSNGNQMGGGGPMGGGGGGMPPF